jgi:outer membrane protein assembly factor BamB
LDPSLRGVRMKCPNKSCRAVFQVEEAVEPSQNAGAAEAATADRDNRVPGASMEQPGAANRVGEMVPILEAEAVDVPQDQEAHAEQSREETPDWHQPPPVRNPHAPRAEDEQVQSPHHRHGFDGEAIVIPPDRPGHDREASVSTIGDSLVGELEPSHRKRKRAIFVVLGMMAVVVGALGYATVTVIRAWQTQEQTLFAQARADYEKGNTQSTKELEEFLTKYPDSQYRQEAEFLLALSNLRDRAYRDENPPSVLDELRSFLANHRGDARLKDNARREDVRQVLVTLAGRMADESPKDPKNSAQLISRGEGALLECPNWRDPKEPTDEMGVKDKLEQAKKTLAYYQRKQRFLEFVIGPLLTKARVTAEDVREARRAAQREQFESDEEVNALISKLEERWYTAIRYVKSDQRFPRGRQQRPETSFLVVPQLTPTADGVVTDNRRVVLALARGVLYALDELSGKPRWVIRVGIDTTTLPVLLPRTPFSPELFLVLSADRNTLMAVSAQDGTLAWQHQLQSACLGRPTIVNRIAYVPTYDGLVEEIETAEGQLLGWFDLGQKLSVGGVWQADTDYLYIPGDSEYLYILDLGGTPSANKPAREKRCVAVLRTGHPSGSLRSEPIVVSRVDPMQRGQGEQVVTSGYLVLNQAEGLNRTKLRVFGLPIERRDEKPLLEVDPVPGWSWFQPYHDDEKVAFATDAGVLALFGINQVRNEDKPLFPLSLKEEKLGDSTGGPARAQVVHAVEYDFWIISSENLQRYSFDYFGQRLGQRWPAALKLGSPLHATQLDASGKTIFLVTQDSARQIDLATAVDAESGKIRWQRQLGVEVNGDPVLVGRDVLFSDRGGGLTRLDTMQQHTAIGSGWRVADSVLANTIEGSAIQSYLLPGPDGASVYQIACPSKGNQLVVRHYQAGADGKNGTVDTKVIDAWPAPIRGTPAIGPNGIILPLANSTTQRLPLPLDGTPGEGGPNWRAAHADEDAQGHVIQLSPDQFLTTDGSRSITLWMWPPKGGKETFHTVPPGKVQLNARIVLAPVVVPGANATDPLRVCVADRDNNLTLLQGPELKPERTWTLKAPITALFARGQRIGCIVDHRQLVWIDPANASPAWKFSTKGQGIVGHPQLFDKTLIVADVSGKFFAIDSTTGKQVGKEYALEASVAPVATPAPFGNENAVAPLSDGTVLLLPLKELAVKTLQSQ